MLYKYIFGVGKRFALLSIGHEPIMLLLHQPTFLFIIKNIFICFSLFINNTKVIAQCKYRTYFFRLQNGCISFMLTRRFEQNKFIFPSKTRTQI